MEVYILLYIATTAVVALLNSDREEWKQFKRTYGKWYNETEEKIRLKSYLENKELIANHNMLYRNGLKSYDLKMNAFGDMTREERRALNGLRGIKTEPKTMFEVTSNGKLAEEVDWRALGAVTAVKEQGSCQSSWAFSATGSLESQRYIKYGNLVYLSEQNLIDCSTSFGNFGCNGGLMDNAFEYINQNRGIDTENSYPYQGKDDVCRFDKAYVGATIEGYVDISSEDESALEQAIAGIGPISAAIDASLDSFHFYNSGIYYEPSCSSTNLDRGVLVVGYGSEKGEEYYIVKNSWGVDWGEEGYIRMSRNRNNNCGIATMASYPLVS